MMSLVKNYISPLIAFAIHIHNNTDRFPNSIIVQYECNTHYNDMLFVTRELLVTHFLEVVKDLTYRSE